MLKLKLHSNTSTIDLSDASKTFVAIDNEASLLSHLQSLTADSIDELSISGLTADDTTLTETFRVLKPGSKLIMENCVPTREAGQALDSDLQITGYLNTMVAKDPVTGYRFAVAQKPSWDTGSAAKVTIAPVTASKWKMNTNDLAEDDLVDESDLLDDGLDTTSKPENCRDEVAAGKKRACKNCTCGLAEEEASGTTSKASATTDDKLVKSSACGNCYKGDAFRCGGCPFLGKPAFEPGQEKVVLTAGVDDFY